MVKAKSHKAQGENAGKIKAKVELKDRDYDQLGHKQANDDQDKSVSSEAGWLQDASLEMPVPNTVSYNQPGKRELEFSVGLRQQEYEGVVRSELRARAVIHADGSILVLAEASYVNVLSEKNVPANIASLLYDSLKPHMESLLALGGHKPPLPASLEKVG